MEVNLPRLVDAILEGWTKCLPPPYGDGSFSPEDGQTDCNRFVNHVCKNLGVGEFENLRANEIHAALIHSKNWLEISSDNAIYYANKGYLVLASWANPDPKQSGHVAVVRPGEGTTSGKWGITEPKVPKLANVGPPKTCRLDRGANYAFGEIPKYFVLKAVGNGRTETPK